MPGLKVQVASMLSNFKGDFNVHYDSNSRLLDSVQDTSWQNGVGDQMQVTGSAVMFGELMACKPEKKGGAHGRHSSACLQ